MILLRWLFGLTAFVWLCAVTLGLLYAGIHTLEWIVRRVMR